MALKQRNQGATSTRPRLLEVRPLTREDLALLQSEYKHKPNRVATFRDSHHRLARLLAAGMTSADAAAATGYSISTVMQFRCDPASQELIAKYQPIAKEIIHDALAERELLVITNGVKAERRLADRLEDEDDDRISTRDLITIARDAADRTGLGKRATNVNVNMTLARDIEEGRLRLEQARLRTIDNVPPSPAAALSRPATSLPQAALEAPRINRRGF